DALASLCGAHFPIEMGAPRTLALYMAVQTTAYVAFVTAKELGSRVHARLFGSEVAAPERGILVYAAGLIFGAPIQLAAHALYLRDHLLSWALALGWTLLVNVVIGAEVARLRRNVDLARELERKERLAAIGQMSARVLHYTRHQIGLIGMSAHQIARRLDALPAEQAEAIRAELLRLESIQEDLGRELTANLGGAPQEDTETPACFGDLVAAQAARLQPLAQERSIRLSVE